MKKLILSLLVSATFGFINAQVLIINPNPVDATLNDIQIEPFMDIEMEHVAVKNNTGDTLHLKWVREVGAECTAFGWQTLVCDNVQCYAAVVSSNINPSVGLEAPFTLKPGETFPNFLLHVRPNMAAGCCPINIHLSTVEEPDVILATINYDVRINDAECALSSTHETSVLEALQVYPNPSTGQFNITDNPLVKNIAVCNLLGQQVARFAHTNGDNHDISNSPDGLYFVNMQDANGATIKTVRITKQGLRP